MNRSRIIVSAAIAGILAVTPAIAGKGKKAKGAKGETKTEGKMADQHCGTKDGGHCGAENSCGADGCGGKKTPEEGGKAEAPAAEEKK